MKVVFITGRHDNLTTVTRNQLTALGFPIDGLYPRPRLNPPPYLPCGTQCTATPFMSNTRKFLEQTMGCNDRGFKLPNPMYNIP